MSARHAGLDALRALALLPVLVVSFGSYATPWASGLLLAPRPADSPLALLLGALAAGLLEAKGVTLLSFLFGYALVLGSRQTSRLKRLLGLGVAHGLLLYFGDILGSYALAGLMAWRRRRERLRRLLTRAAVWLLVGAVLAVLLNQLGGEPATAKPAPFAMPHEAEGLAEWWRANAAMYGWVVLMLPVILPWTYGLMLLGLAAGRLRLLTHRRWQTARQRCARWALPLLLANLAYGAWVMAAQPPASLGLSALVALFTLPSWVCWLLQRRLPAVLAQAGRQTLSIYLTGSLILVLLFSPAGVGLDWGSAATLVLAVLLWWALVQGAAALSRRGRRGPFEAWLARRPG